MGVVQRQGLSASVMTYTGMFLGFIISVLVFPKVLGREIYGFTQWIVFVASVLSVFSLVGLNMVTIKFFPYFRDKSKQHDGFLGFLLLIASATLSLTVFLLFLFKPSIINLFGNEKSEGYVEQYYYLIAAVLVITNYFSVLNSYSSALFRPRVSIFFVQVFSRILTLLLIGLYYIGWIDVDGFIKLYAFKNLLNIVGLLIYLKYIGELHSKLDFGIFKRPVFREMTKYGAFATFSQVGNEMITRVDVLMIAPMLDFSFTGVYTVFVFVSMAIIITYQGLASITGPLIAEAWKNEDMHQIQDLYYRTALNNLVVGLLFYIGIVANLDNLIGILGEEYAAGKMVAVLLGLGQIVRILNGYNGLIIVNSPYYRFELISKGITLIVTILTNYFFIKAYGLIGAAIATLITLVLSSCINLGYVYFRFRMHPFSWGTLKTIALGILVLGIGLQLPVIESSIIFDIAYRSVLMAAIYGMLVLSLKVSPDINEYVKRTVENFYPSGK